jgi:type II secretory pathway component PulF
MPNFKYKAITQEGRVIESVLLAPDEKDVTRQLTELHMIPISVSAVKSKRTTSQLSFKVKDATVIMFTKQLYTLLKAGVPIISSLNAVKEQTSDANFKGIVESIVRDIEQGSKFSDALGQFSKVFSPLYINSIRIGEVSGTLEESLQYLHRYMDEDAKLRSEVKKALRYPMFVMIGIIGAFIVFTTTVIPNFIPMFKASGAELPLPTKILIGIHDVFANYWYILILVVAGIIGSVYLYSKTPRGRFQLDLLSLRAPIFGKFMQKVLVSRFAKLFYTMNRTGINITKAFEILQDTIGNKVYHQEIKSISDKIIKGEGIANSIKSSPYFTSLLVEMVGIGEKSGALDDMLFSVSQYYDQEVSDAVKNLTSLIEPAVTIILGGMILLLALSMFMPMWEMMKIL